MYLIIFEGRFKVRKLKLYLDTSVISYLFAEDVPDKMQDTLDFWEDLKSGKYEIFISDVVTDEINKCKEPKLNILKEYMIEIDFYVLNINKETETLAESFISNGILSLKSMDDCYHIALAMQSGCDFIVSWNFKHMVNIKTIRGVKIISGITNYPEISIYSPSMLLENKEV